MITPFDPTCLLTVSSNGFKSIHLDCKQTRWKSLLNFLSQELESGLDEHLLPDSIRSRHTAIFLVNHNPDLGIVLFDKDHPAGLQTLFTPVEECYQVVCDNY